ncbi:tRNA methyltransferase 2 [Bulinus truncatus]|nr:tRNA methyltransferase 2 [Bulinus truncatus]
MDGSVRMTVDGSCHSQSNFQGKHTLDLDEENNSKRIKVDIKKEYCCNEDTNEQGNKDPSTQTENTSTTKVSTISLDPLNYTKSKEFTSEIFKIQIYNLPKFGFADLKKRLKSALLLNPHKIKRIEKTSVTYVCFRSEAERDEALRKINGHTWKGKILEAKVAAPVADPYLQKKLQEKDDNTSRECDPAPKIEHLTTDEAEARLKSNVCPLWDTGYTQQLQMKEDKIRSVLEQVAKHHFVRHLFKDRSKYGGLPCELLPIIPSPIITAYRNKNEFSIGFGLDGKTKMVGFRYGLYKEGSTAVGDCTNLGVVMPAAIPVLKSFTEFIRVSQWEPFLQQTGTGHWHTLTVRTFQSGDVMVMADFQPRTLDEKEIEAAKTSLKNFYTDGEGKGVSIKSLYFRLLGGKGLKDQKSIELLFGEPHVYETLMQLKFRISPEAFFQVNTAATEKLYELIADWCSVSPSTTVLDICCGTGTIGLSMAKKVKNVIGIEMCKPAIEDAMANATINDLQLPPNLAFADLKKRLKSALHLNPHKIKRIEKTSVTYVCFRSEAERDEALRKINGHTWKGKILEAKIAAPVADPYLQKKLQEKDDNTSRECEPAPKIEHLTTDEAEGRLKSNVCPLWDTDYTQQLQMKEDKIRSVLEQVAKHHFVRHLFKDRSKYGGLPCELLPIIPSPIITAYRNKNEFSIGFGLDGKTKMVGFRYGLYKEGSTAVGDCTNLGVVMPAAIPVLKSFTEFIRVSQWEPFLQQTGTGHWHTLTVRTFQSGDVMVMADFQPRTLDEKEIEAAKTSLKNFYTDGEGKGVSIKSLYFRLLGGKGLKDQKSIELLFGEPHVYETLMQLKFRISPEAFFQVNTAATEKLYELIADWCSVSPSTTVLDICCGTGTIGLSMAKKVKTVIGIEMCKPAIEDAMANATINDIPNAVFHCAKVEDIINKTISSLSQSDHQDVVAVVDPPRAGLHKEVLKSLRKCDSIRHLVYVSCNPESAMDNFVDIIRPETGRHKGRPFRMVKATPVDLFPGTKHCELVILYTRDTTKLDRVMEKSDIITTDAGIETDKMDRVEEMDEVTQPSINEQILSVTENAS